MTRPRFYMVWNPTRSLPKFQHVSLEAARKEAERLARQNLNETFIVLVSVGEAKIHDPIEWTEHDDLPF